MKITRFLFTYVEEFTFFLYKVFTKVLLEAKNFKITIFWSCAATVGKLQSEFNANPSYFTHLMIYITLLKKVTAVYNS